MNHSTAIAVLLACAAATNASQAADGLSASIKYSNIGFSVTDLTPFDGVAPFYELLPSDHWKSTTSISRDQPPFFDSDNLVPFLGNASVSKAFDDGTTALAQVTGNSIEASIFGATSTTYLIHASANLVGGHYAPLIRVASGTKLTFSGYADLNYTADCPRDCSANGVLQGVLGPEGGDTYGFFWGSNAGPLFPSSHLLKKFELSYSNTSGHDQEISLVVNADVWLSNTAVPEPSTWALALGGGLIALRFGQRRRQG